VHNGVHRLERASVDSTEKEQEMTRKRGLTALVASVTVAAAIATGVIATTGAASAGKASGNKLAGTWVVTVSRPAPLPPLVSLQVFTKTGSVIETANESPQTRTPSFGSWERIHGHLYAASAVFFRYDAGGNFIGSQKIDRTIEVAPDGETFKHVARVTVLDANGNALASFVARAAGERMAVDQIPDLP